MSNKPSLRQFLDRLEGADALHRVTRRVHPEFEIGAILGLRDTGPAQLFETVDGPGLAVVGNILNSRPRFALAFGIAPEALDDHCAAAVAGPVPPVTVDHGPVQDEVFDGTPDLAALLPVPRWFERETAPYITAGVIVARDPETGRRNLSIARLRLEGGNRVMAGIAANHHLNILARKAGARGEPLEFAVAIGNHPAVLLASQMYVDLGRDEFGIAGGLLGEPVELVPCRTVGLEIPAEAEIVLEGVLRPDQPIEEGPVSEFPGFYVRYGPGIAGEIRCVTRRKDAIFQAILPGFASEHCLLGAVAIGATLRHELSRTIPAVRSVVVTDGGMGRLHAVIAMHRPRLGEGKRAIMLAMGLVNLLKLVIAVDDDVDPHDWKRVEWSLAARFRGEEDLIVLPGVKADRCDPVHENLTVTKIGMVATTRPGDGEPGTRSEFARPPADVLARIRRDLDLY